MGFPFDITETIALHLQENPAAVRSMSMVCRAFSGCTRPILFRTLTITNTDRLRQLFELLSSPNCTIPYDIHEAVIDFRALEWQEAQLPIAMQMLEHSILELLWRTRVCSTLSLHLPWTLTRVMDAKLWERAAEYSSLNSLVLSGAYSRLSDAVELVAKLLYLESLNISATWKNDGIPSSGELPPSLKTVSLSSSSLAFMAWMSTLEEGPDRLTNVRLMIDGSPHLTHLHQLRRFMQKFGPGLKHLCFWFEEVPNHVYHDVADAVRDIPCCTRLSACFPSISILEDAQAYAEVVCSRLRNVIFLWVGQPWSAKYDPTIYKWDEVEELAAQEERICGLEVHASQYIQLRERSVRVDDVLSMMAAEAIRV